MRYETMTLGSNVIRFPVELRAKPSIDLLVEVAPDSPEVELIAEAFGFEAPDPDGRSRADRAMAETIAKTDLPADPKERRAALNAMLSRSSIARSPPSAKRARRRCVRMKLVRSLPARRSRAAIGWLRSRTPPIIGRSSLRGFSSRPMRPRRRPMGRDGRSSSPSAARPGARPMSKRTSTPSSPRNGRSPARAALLPFRERAVRRAHP
jgi:hypothetical protein